MPSWGEHWRPGSTRAWRKLRARRLEFEPNCRSCKKVQATEVDHIIPLSRGGQRYDFANTQSLCANCHKAKSDAERRKPKVRHGVDPATGRPLDPSHHWNS